MSSTLVDVVTRASGYPGTRECFHGVKTDTDNPQSMQEPRRRLLTRDDQDSYDAMSIRRDSHERGSYSSGRQRILGTQLLRMHIRTLRGNRHIYEIHDTRAVLLNIDSYWLCANISITHAPLSQVFFTDTPPQLAGDSDMHAHISIAHGVLLCFVRFVFWPWIAANARRSLPDGQRRRVAYREDHRRPDVAAGV